MAKVITLKNGKVDIKLVKSWLKQQLYVVEPSDPVPWEEVEWAIEDEFGSISEEQLKEIREWLSSHPTLSAKVSLPEEEGDEESVKEGAAASEDAQTSALTTPTPNIYIYLSRKEYKKQMSYMYQFHQRLLHNNPELELVSTDPKYWKMVESELGIDRTNAGTWVRALMTALWKRYPDTWKEELVKKLEEYGFTVKLMGRKKRGSQVDVDKERERYIKVLKRAKESLQNRLKEIEEEKKAIGQRLKEIEQELSNLGA